MARFTHSVTHIPIIQIMHRATVGDINVAVYKLGPFMSIDVRRRQEWEENEYTR